MFINEIGTGCLTNRSCFGRLTFLQGGLTFTHQAINPTVIDTIKL